MQRIPEDANWAVVAERKTVAPWGECSQHLDFGLAASKIVREYTSLVLCHRFAAIHYGSLRKAVWRGFVLGRTGQVLLPHSLQSLAGSIWEEHSPV